MPLYRQRPDAYELMGNSGPLIGAGRREDRRLNMGWKTINGRQYYYECERVGGKVRTKYLGTGRYGEMLAQLAAGRRAEETAMRGSRRAERERDEAEERELDDWFDSIEALAD